MWKMGIVGLGGVMRRVEKESVEAGSVMLGVGEGKSSQSSAGESG